MGKLIYEDKALWKKTVIDNLKVVNQHKPENERLSEEQIEKLAEERVNDKKRVDRYLSLVKDKNDQEAANHIIENLKKEYNEVIGTPYVDHGMGQILRFYMDLSGTKEAEEKNRKLVYDMADPIKARKAVADTFKTLLKADKKRWFKGTTEEKIDFYNENKLEVWSAFAISRMFETATDQLLNPEFKKLFNENVALFESAGAIINQIQPFTDMNYLTYPDGNSMELLAISQELGKAQGKNLVGVDGFNIVGSNVDTSAASYAAKLVVLDGINEKNKPIKDVFDQGYIPKTIGYDYRIVENKKTIKTNDGIISLAKNGNVEVLKKSDEEIKDVDRLIDHAYFIPELVKNEAEFAVGTFENFYKNLKNADHWYNFNNSPEYNNLLAGLEEVINDQKNRLQPYNLLKDHAPRIKELADAYVAAKAPEKKNTNRQLRFDLCKELSEFCSSDFINLNKACPSVTDDAKRLEEEELLREELQDAGLKNELNERIETIDGKEIENSLEIENGLEAGNN